jgi:hypothetical protein
MATVQPDIVMHQLTDLSLGLEPRQMAEAIGHNARIRIEGPKNLVAAALVAGTGRMIAQSIAWAYAPGARPYSENDHLDLDAEGTRAISVRGVAMLERLTITSQPLEGAVLRLDNYTVQEPAVIKRAAPRHSEIAGAGQSSFRRLPTIRQTASAQFHLSGLK